MQAVTTIEQLKNLASNEDGFDGFISLAGGIVRSSKQIWYDAENDSWSVFHSIDDTDVDYASSAAFVDAEMNITEAIQVGVLYSH